MTWALIIGGIVVALLLVGVFLFNRVVRLRNEVDTGWSNIDVQLKRRNDLIPNLVEAVKGYAAHERGVTLCTAPPVGTPRRLARPARRARYTFMSERMKSPCVWQRQPA